MFRFTVSSVFFGSRVLVWMLLLFYTSLYRQKFIFAIMNRGGSVAEWLACWTQVQKGQGSNRSRDAVG